GFPHRVLAEVERQWHAFLAAHGTDPTAEFLLTSAVGEQVADGGLRLRVLPVHCAWFGMTFADDAPDVRRRIAELVDGGEYPVHLREGLS
ncbi:MAG: nucleotidyltransferase, partial [Gemmatimonadales bacterium]|nr:nucleotidyltransferase [Gemmatimonadales bacterium]